MLNLLALLLSVLSLFPVTSDYETLKRQAEVVYAEGSYARAHEIYASVKRDALPPAEQRWVRFRVADTMWRAEAADPKRDDTEVTKARDELLALLREIGDDHDRLWAEINESLGDLTATPF